MTYHGRFRIRDKKLPDRTPRMAKLLNIIKSKGPLTEEAEPARLESIPDEKLRETDLVSLLWSANAPIFSLLNGTWMAGA